jgi:hypothetical protein
MFVIVIHVLLTLVTVSASYFLPRSFSMSLTTVSLFVLLPHACCAGWLVHCRLLQQSVTISLVRFVFVAYGGNVFFPQVGLDATEIIVLPK